jgi:hypothetical protein
MDIMWARINAWLKIELAQIPAERIQGHLSDQKR